MIYRLRGRKNRKGESMEWCVMDMKDPSKIKKSFSNRKDAIEYAHQFSKFKKMTDTRPLEYGSYRNMKSVTESTTLQIYTLDDFILDVSEDLSDTIGRRIDVTKITGLDYMQALYQILSTVANETKQGLTNKEIVRLASICIQDNFSIK